MGRANPVLICGGSGLLWFGGGGGGGGDGGGLWWASGKGWFVRGLWKFAVVFESR